MSKKKIVAFAGSNSSKSINRELVKYTLSYFSEFDINLLDLNDFEMPIYSMDREQQHGIPEKANLFRKQMEEANAIICSMAEHNRSYTVAFKNIFDWSSRVDLDIFKNKPMLLMSTSPGGFGGGNVMNAAKAFFPKCGAEVIETFSLPSFYKTFSEGEILDPDLKEELIQKIEVFRKAL
ncbi:NAD(P)H-dependent oxidoreductase [Limibacter armeniacum]|uniref:NADPH-dependent FMN reductase n=1 Tax=Limibacter armeniacum TaxID=466084 RepID=UPI002FE5738C